MRRGLVWFKNDLRVQDNISLHKGLSENDSIIAVYFFDPRLFESEINGFRKIDKFRAKFLLETVTQLRENLEKLQIPLLVYQQRPEDVIPKLVIDKDIAKVYTQNEWTSEERQVLIAAKASTKMCNLDWVESYDQFLFHPEDLPFEINKVPHVFTPFRKLCEKEVSVRVPLQNKAISGKDNYKNVTKMPSLKDLGYAEFEKDSRTAFPFNGGENNGEQRMHSYFFDTKNLSQYKKTRNGLVGINYSSKLSAWLANGSISPRMIYYQVREYEEREGKNNSTYWLIFELIWRDFFKYISMKHRNDIFRIEGILHKKYSWQTDKKLIRQWVHGETSEAFVNANMIELKNTGWMSNRGRQNVASYFAKELQLDWRIGAAYFESMLIDYDVHSNYGNWLYVAGVGNDPRDRKFNIQLQAERYDPEQKFQNLWLQPTLF
ncbi:DASH family cryptochrome [Aquimarina pacifica]|uniref:DASH family cryptochrome n=1 Tax=Aquimarina pacifica TaxID=1296415 RepID=UPI0004724343|nr:DASH family cryptochrome [Aquimarina pacifica]